MRLGSRLLEGVCPLELLRKGVLGGDVAIKGSITCLLKSDLCPLKYLLSSELRHDRSGQLHCGGLSEEKTVWGL